MILCFNINLTKSSFMYGDSQTKYRIFAIAAVLTSSAIEIKFKDLSASKCSTNCTLLKLTLIKK